VSKQELAQRLGPLRAKLPGRAEPLPLASPESEPELAQIISTAHDAGLKVLAVGAGSRLGGSYGCQADLLVSTRKLSGVVAYEPGDGTITALAGTLMSELAACARAGGHRLTPDIPRPETATLGGVLADGLSGGDRLRFGPTRHHVLGMRVLLADGTITKTGGRLVKNVTGFEMHRLYAGSAGSLCIILEATMRLFPAPAERAFGTIRCGSLEEALHLSAALSAPPLEPTAITLSKLNQEWSLSVTLDGRSERVNRERSIAEERAPRAEWSLGAEADAAYVNTRDSSPEEGDTASLRVSVRPSRLHTILKLVLAHAPTARLLAHPAVGTLELSLDEASEHSNLVTELREASATVRVRGASDDAAPRKTAALEARLQQALDPEDVFCGRP
jgi:glycolate oxidase FAD binding subunit